MESADWPPQSIVTLVAGLLATVALRVVTADALAKAGRRATSSVSPPSVESPTGVFAAFRSAFASALLVSTMTIVGSARFNWAPI